MKIEKYKNRIFDWFISKRSIEILWSFIGGMVFSFLPLLTDTGTDFNLYRWGLRLTRGFSWKHPYVIDDEFIFGFLITFVLIWSVKRYQSLK